MNKYVEAVVFGLVLGCLPEIVLGFWIAVIEGVNSFQNSRAYQTLISWLE